MKKNKLLQEFSRMKEVAGIDESGKDNKTSLHICGFWFHIMWENDGEGYDQHGNKWINKNNPECTNKDIVNSCLDSFNNINRAVTGNGIGSRS